MQEVFMENNQICDVCGKKYNNYNSEWKEKIKTLFTYGMPNICGDCLAHLFMGEPSSKQLQSYLERNYKVDDYTIDFKDNSIVYRTKSDYISGVNVNEKMNLDREDIFIDIFIDNNKDYIVVTEKGRLCILSSSDIPSANGDSVEEINLHELIDLENDDNILSMQPWNLNKEDYLLLTTSHGIVKKFTVESLNPNELNEVIKLKENDRVISFGIVKKGSYICMFTIQGNAILFEESQVLLSDTKKIGVQGIKLQLEGRERDKVVSVLVLDDLNSDNIVLATKYGYGFKFPASNLKCQKKGGKGKNIVHITEKNGEVVHAQVIKSNEKAFIYFVSSKNHVLKMIREEVNTMPLGALGQKLIQLDREKETILFGYHNLVNRLATKIEIPKRDKVKKVIIDSIKDIYKVTGVLPYREPVPLIPQLNKEAYIPCLKFYAGLPYRGEIKFLFGNWYQLLADAGLIELEKIGKYGVVCVAKDGHVCRSLQEKFIDDWLFEHNIQHEPEPIYPYHHELNKNKMRADFKVGDVWIEYFGLNTNLYNKKIQIKRNLSKLESLHLVELFPDDMKREILEKKLGFLIK
jgi:hypothetical protein